MPENEKRQFVKFNFYKLDPQWRRLEAAERRRGQEEFLATVAELSGAMMIVSYNLQGLRADADFMLWQASPTLEALQELASRLAYTGLGKYLTTSYSYLSMTRRSMYVGQHRHGGQEGTRTTIRPAGHRYMFLYPFVKTRAWYKLGKTARQGMMNEHFAVGHKFPSVHINTTYSYGLDDQEFVLAFETDEPGDFLDLVMELRESDASSYTERDTPIFTCVNMDLKEILESL